MFACYQSRVILIAIVKSECTILLLQKYVCKVYVLYSLVFDHIFLKFVSIYDALTQADEQ